MAQPYLPNYLGAIKGGIETGEAIRAIGQRGALEGLAPQIAQGSEEAIQQAYGIDPTGKSFGGALEHAQAQQPAGAAMFEGTGFDQQAVNVQAREYMQAGFPQQEALRRAVDDVMRSKVQSYVDVEGRRIETRGLGLPPVTPEQIGAARRSATPADIRVANKVAQAPRGGEVQVMLGALAEEEAAGEDVDYIPEEQYEQAAQVFAGVGRATEEEPPTVRVARKSRRAELSETRRGKLIDSTYEAGERAQGIGQNVLTIKDNLDSLVRGGAATGPAAPVVSFLNDLGAQAGLNIDLNEASSLAQIEGASNSLAVPLVKQLGVNPTDKDFAIIKSTVARAGTSVPANYSFLYTLDQVANRQEAISEIVRNAQEEGADEIEMKRRMRNFNKESHVSQAVPLPKNRGDVKEGKIYTTNRGVFRFDGQNMVRVF